MIAIKDVELQAAAQGANQYKLTVKHTLVAGNDDVGRSFRVSIRLLGSDQGEQLITLGAGALATFFFPKSGWIVPLVPYYDIVPIQAGNYHRTAVQIVPAATLNEDPGYDAKKVHMPPDPPMYILETRPDEIYAVVRASLVLPGQQGLPQSVEAKSPVVTVVV